MSYISLMLDCTTLTLKISGNSFDNLNNALTWINCHYIQPLCVDMQ